MVRAVGDNDITGFTLAMITWRRRDVSGYFRVMMAI